MAGKEHCSSHIVTSINLSISYLTKSPAQFNCSHDTARQTRQCEISSVAQHSGRHVAAETRLGRGEGHVSCVILYCV